MLPTQRRWLGELETRGCGSKRQRESAPFAVFLIIKLVQVLVQCLKCVCCGIGDLNKLSLCGGKVYSNFLLANFQTSGEDHLKKKKKKILKRNNFMGQAVELDLAVNLKSE